MTPVFSPTSRRPEARVTCRWPRALRFLVLVASPWVFAAEPAPAVDWVLPLFTDAEGYRSMTLRGATARPVNDVIHVTGLHVTIFSGDARAEVETVLLSEDATFYPDENRVTGEKMVRVIRDELEVTGEDWSYDHPGKKVSIKKNVRVVYRAPLHLPL